VTLKPPTADEIITKRKKILRMEQDCAGIKLDVSTKAKPVSLLIAVAERDRQRGTHQDAVQGNSGCEGRDY
jgi:hypothetical protein